MVGAISSVVSGWAAATPLLAASAAYGVGPSIVLPNSPWYASEGRVIAGTVALFHANPYQSGEPDPYDRVSLSLAFSNLSLEGCWFPVPITLKELEAILVPAFPDASLYDSLGGLKCLQGSQGRCFITLDPKGFVSQINFKGHPAFLPPENPKRDLRDFIALLRATGKLGHFVSENPYFAYEQKVHRHLQDRSLQADVTPVHPDLPANISGVLIVPDRDHGAYYYVAKLLHYLGEQAWDWLGLEMVPHTLQGAVDSYLGAEKGSVEFTRARQSLIDFFSVAWVQIQGMTGERSPYLQVLDLCKARGIPVIALDVAYAYGQATNHAALLIHGTRNLFWAERLPTAGRGIVFGGQAHFQSDLTHPGMSAQHGYYRGLRVQDFYAERYTGPLAIIDWT